jgi:hypothetical protein
MIRVKVAGMEFICETAKEAADFLLLLESNPKADSRGFDITYLPGGKRSLEIVDGYDFIMAIRPIQGRELDSTAIAKHFRLKGIQGLGPFFLRIKRLLQQVNPPRTLGEFVEKRIVVGKPTCWKILRENKKNKSFSLRSA